MLFRRHLNGNLKQGKLTKSADINPQIKKEETVIEEVKVEEKPKRKTKSSTKKGD